MSMLGIPVLRQGNIIELKPLNSFDTKKLEQWLRPAAASAR